MIPNIDEKCDELVEIINTRIMEIDDRYRGGPSLYFYSKILARRRGARSVRSFLRKRENIEWLYATLVSWDMNSRGAKMKDFDLFAESISDNIRLFQELERYSTDIENVELDDITETVSCIYNAVSLMATNQRLVSNSKFLHFVFPDLLMPMDGTNTLSYCYGNTGESVNKYIEILGLSFRIAQVGINWDAIVTNEDGRWNRSIPKIIDNAIILATGNSVE